MTTEGARSRRDRGSGPRAFRRFLEKRGPVFIKIGQFLALRPDLIPPEYCDELMSLLDRVTPVAWPDIRRIIKADLGAEPFALFAHIDTRPLGSGSLAQTHYARLHDGRAVAVKVLRPDITARVTRDLRHLRRLARLLALGGASFIVDPVETVDELAHWMMQELDLVRERGNIERLGALAERSSFQFIPRAFPELCGPHVLTMDYVRGTRVIDLFAPSAHHGSHRHIDRDQLAEDLIEASLTQIFRYRFFHADLHPGNLIVPARGGIAFVDFGLCERLDDDVRARQMQYLTALYQGDNERVYRALLDILDGTDRADPEGLRRDFLRAIRSRLDNEDRAAMPGISAARSPIAIYLIDVIRAARSNGYQVPPRVLGMYRALLTAETVAHRLGSRRDLRAVGRRFIEQLQCDDVCESLDPERLKPALLGHLAAWRDAPIKLHQLLADLADDRFVLKTSNADSPDLRRERNRRSRGSIAATLSVSVAILLAVAGLRWPDHIWLQGTLFAALLLLFLLAALNYRALR
ncbi:MAG: AarF/UbiB family protein [Pseudorhodoplanes sp.]